MAKTKYIPKKEKFKLAIEYLKRNKIYKEICCALRNKNEAEGNEIYFRKFAALDKKGDLYHMYYFYFGDIYTQTFDHWWKEHLRRKKKRIDDITSTILDVYSKRERISPEDFAYANIQECLDPLLDVCIIKINALPMWDEKSLIKEFLKIVEAAKKRIANQGFFTLTPPIRFDELKHYLEVYDQWKKEKSKKGKRKGSIWKKLLIKFHPDYKKKPAAEKLSSEEYDKLIGRESTLERSLKRDREKAERIIQNVGKGEFPGYYEKDQAAHSC